MSISETLVLARAIAWKSIVLRMRYAFNTATNVITVYAFFLLLVYGSRTVAPTPAPVPEIIPSSLSSLVVGCFLLLMATVAYSSVSWELIREAQWGTLEQLFMSPIGFGWVVLITTSVNVAVSFTYGIVLLALLSLMTGDSLVIDPLTVVPIGLLALGSAVGVGFTLGGLALVFERIGNVFQIVQLAFVVCVVTPVEGSLLLKLLPLSLGGYLLRRSMDAGLTLWELPQFDLGLLLVKSIAYVVIGYAVFQYAGHVARNQGQFGRY